MEWRQVWCWVSAAEATMSKGSPLWQCINGCGACCRLDPERRGEALAALNAEQRATYMDLVAADGWCRHFDTGNRRCRIYADRPDFCRVQRLLALFGQEGEDFDSFAISCCLQQIRSEEGGRGRVMKRFMRAIRRQP